MKMAEARRRLQTHELRIRIDWLKDHVQRLESKPQMRSVVAAWRREVLEKQQLSRELEAGIPVTNSSIRARVDAAYLMRSDWLRRHIHGR
jgi:hypothetical protein